jgi:hypothetical protein
VNIALLRAAMKTALASVDGLEVYDYEAQRPQEGSAGAAVVRLPQNIDPRQVFGGIHWNYQIAVTLLVGLTDAEAADRALDRLLAEDGPASSSAVVALRADPTFGGACQTSVVTSMGPFGLLLDQMAIGGDVTFEVLT